MSTEATKVTIAKSNAMDEKEFPKASIVDGRYVTPWETGDKTSPAGWSNFKSFFTPDSSKIPGEDKLNEEPLMQMVKADPKRIENPPENGIRVTWLGHASVLFQLDNVNILINPNFNARGIKYYHPGNNKRYREPVYTVEQLPRIDAILISNTHFDLLDLSSVRLLNERFGETPLWYVPAGVKAWMEKAGCVNVVELEWWKEVEKAKVTKVKFVFCPSQNHHSRTFDDDNAVLWGSWAILTPRYKLFYVGGTGYCEVFKSIGRKYGPFHMAALPIGGYHPADMFAYANCTPEEAVKIHQDLLAMHSLAISWGTFILSNEFYLDPPHRLQEELKKKGLSDMQFFLLKHGESRLTEIKELNKKQGDVA
eukprot:Seg4152.2 transcript_id=Seg4152.2/GoldUCD/mRNA.D3Y31 product="N-acyl-phosphatidylethanolamine-hydrolyzing phospholipase D" protein_id=Seg4152.2/GoldUCD/D3Y31